jgi:hypothetical protein
MASPSLWAQSPAAEMLQQSVALRPEAEPPTPVNTSDADLGEVDAVQKLPKPEMFTFSTTQQLFYTDNVFYTNTKQIASGGYLGSYTASFVPYSLRDWTPRISLQYNMVRYGNAAEGDFDNENIAVSNQYVFSDDRSWTWTPSILLSRFTTPHANDHEFYQEVVYDSQVAHVQEIGKDTHLFFIASYDLAYHQASPAQFDRLDNTLSFSLAYYPVPELRIGPFVQPSARIYFTNTTVTTSNGNSFFIESNNVNTSVQHDRDDLNISEGLDVTWTPIKYFSVSGDVLHTNDYSNNSGFSYNDTIPGLSLSGTYKF